MAAYEGLSASTMATLTEMQAKARCQIDAANHYFESVSASHVRRAKYTRYHSYYAPLDGDQWPEDRAKRPGKLHITANYVKSFIDVESRILSLLPRVTNIPSAKDPTSRKNSEIVEDLFMRWLELSDWESWMVDWNRVKSIYGLGILRPVWDEVNKRPDVRVIEQPHNLHLGWGTSDFAVLDWAIYVYFISVAEAKRRFPGISITEPGDGKPLEVARTYGDHTDPLAQLAASGADSLAAQSASTASVKFGQTRTIYEDRQVECWDYWYYDDEGNVHQAYFVQRVIVDGPTPHPEMPRIPYIVVENDHEPGSPDGMSSVEALINVQMGLNRAVSHYAQVIADNSGTAYQLRGENAGSIPEGLIPREDEVVAPGDNNWIEPVARTANPYNLQQLITEYKAQMHEISGIPAVMFGNLPSADTSGRAMTIQIEAAANRLDPKRRRAYNGLRDLMVFWGYMAGVKNPEITVTKTTEAQQGDMASPEPSTQKIKIGDFIKGFDRWKIVAPEITPRDSIENAQNVINLVNAKLIPLIEGMDQIGVENPEQMLALVESERSNARLYPESVQQYAGAIQLLSAIMASQQAAASAQQQQGPLANSAQGAQQQAQPSKLNDQNQPMTQAGSAPPPGAGSPPIGAELQGLLRSTPSGQGQALSQIKLPPVGF